MTRLRKLMLDELQRRNYAQSTVRTYIKAIEDFARHFGKSPEKLGPEHIRAYQVHLFRDRKLAAGTVEQRGAALRFFYIKTLHRPYLPDQIPLPKRVRRLPVVLSPDENRAAHRFGEEPDASGDVDDAVCNGASSRGVVPLEGHRY